MSVWIEMVPGIHRRTLASSAHMMLMEVQLKAGSSLPIHSHPQEQVTYVVKGRLRMMLAGEPHELAAGDVLLMLGDALHGVEVLEDALVIDTFSPPRWDLLEQDRAAGE